MNSNGVGLLLFQEDCLMELGECVNSPGRVRPCLRQLKRCVRGRPTNKPEPGSGSGLEPEEIF